MFEFKDRYVAVFVKTINGVPTIQGRKKFKSTKNTISFRKHSYKIDPGKVTYRSKSNFVYYIDLDTGQTQFGKEGSVFNPEMLDIIEEQKILPQLVSGLVSMGKVPWVWAVVFITMGLLGGYIIHSIIFP